MGIDEIESMLNRRSGMLGLSGDSDMRSVQARIDSGDEDAQVAYDVYIHRLRKYVGAYLPCWGTVMSSRSPRVWARTTPGSAGMR